MNIKLAEKIVELALKSDSKSKAEVDPNFRKGNGDAAVKCIDALTILKLVIENADQFVDSDSQVIFKQANLQQWCRDVFY